MKRLAALEAALLRAGAQLVSPGGRRGSLLVLIYHRVLPAPDPLLADEPVAETFAAQMDLIANLFTVLRLSEAVDRLGSGSLPARAVCITFDDGYANNRELAAPILAARKLTATFFVSTGFIEGGQMWNDTVIDAVRRAAGDLDLVDLGLGRFRLTDIAARRAAIDAILPRLKHRMPAERARLAEAIAARVGVWPKRQPMMTERQLRELAAFGMEVGAHCVSHPILASLRPDVARSEIADSKRRLEEILGEPVRSFAYPNGRPGTDYGREHVAMVRAAGFSAAVSTAWGAATRATDRYQIPRVAPWDLTARRYGLRMLRAFTERCPTPV